MRIELLADVILSPGQSVGAGTMVDVDDTVGTALVGSALARPAKWERMPEHQPEPEAEAEKPKPVRRRRGNP